MCLNFAPVAVVVGAGKGYFLAVGVDAHPIDGFIVVAVEVCRMVDVKLVQQSLKISVLEVFFLHLNKKKLYNAQIICAFSCTYYAIYLY